MSVNEQLVRLINASTPYWAGESEVFRVYFDSEKRTRETDRRWLGYQAWKEVWAPGFWPIGKGAYLGPAEDLLKLFPKIDGGIDRHSVLELAELFTSEFRHYCAFADAYDGLAEKDEPKMTPFQGKIIPEDEILANLRYEHQRKYPHLGVRATRFTEGGYCTLFREGMKLKNRSGGPHAKANALIAEACSKVYNDEFQHMLRGIAERAALEISASDWDLLIRLTVDQLKARIVYRNAQFGTPLGPERMSELLQGKAAPLEFDYARAGLSLA